MSTKSNIKVNSAAKIAVQVALNALNLLFLGYLIVYASACPTPALLGAVAAETAVYAGLIAYRIWRMRRKGSRPGASEELEAIVTEWTALNRLRNLCRLAFLVVAGIVTIYFATDFTALLLARSGDLKSACSIYRKICILPSPSIHPALSLELLAGANIESNNFPRAISIAHALYDLRKSLVGEKSELIAEMASNLADLYVKAGRPAAEAEFQYRKSIALTRELKLPKGYGSPMTKLGTLLGLEGRYEEADKAFADAIAIRSKIFGRDSFKVAETLQAQVPILNAQGRTVEARQLDDRAKSILAAGAPRREISNAAVPVCVSAASLVLYWKRDRILVIAANFFKHQFRK